LEKFYLFSLFKLFTVALTEYDLLHSVGSVGTTTVRYQGKAQK